MTSHVFSRDYKLTLANLHGPPPSEYTLNTLHWKFFHHSAFLNNLHLPWKTVFPEIFHCIDCILFIIQEILATCACHEKQIWPEILHCIEIFLSFRIFEQLSNLYFSWKFSLYEIYFLHSVFLSNLRLPWKTECALNSLTECIFFIIQDFWATCICAEKQSCPEIFHCFEIFFIIQEVWATCACPENIISSRGAATPRHPPRMLMGLWYRGWKHYIFYCLENDNIKTA